MNLNYSKKILFILLLTYNTSNLFCIISKEYIAYSLNGGRLGDCIVSFCKARYFSYKFKIPMLFKPFKHAHELYLSVNQLNYTSSMPQEFQNVVHVKSAQDIINNRKPSTLFEVSFYANLSKHGNHDIFPFDFLLKKMQKHPDFYRDISSMLKPIKPFPVVELPKNCITIAMHIRKGSAADYPLYSQQIFEYPIKKIYQDMIHPFKFPPEQYYIEQLKRLSALVNHAPLFVQIFTDAQDPRSIYARLEQALQDHKNIKFSYKSHQNWQTSELEDLFAMVGYDCLIRSCSNYGGLAQLLWNYKIIIGPNPLKTLYGADLAQFKPGCASTGHEWHGNKLIICESIFYFNDSKTFKQYIYEHTNLNTLQEAACSTLKLHQFN